jgi:hypothetical protein
MIQWFFISGYVLQNMLQVGFGKTFQNLSYFDQSVAYVLCVQVRRCEQREYDARNDRNDVIFLGLYMDEKNIWAGKYQYVQKCTTV